MAGLLRGFTLFLFFFVCLFGKKARKVNVLKRQLLVALRERDGLTRHVASLIRQRDRAIRRPDDAVLRLALQRVQLLEWVHNVEPVPVEGQGGEDEGFISGEE